MPPSSIHMDHIRATQQAMRAESAGTPTPQKADSKEEGMSFWDVLDVVNPLQHIPIVNKIYQAVTGDTIKTPAKLAGSALFFGPIGLAVAAADAVVEKETGKDTLDNVASMVGLGDKPQDEGSVIVTDDPVTVTITHPRPQKAEAVAEQPQKAAALPVQELTDGQAAALERLMAASQGTPGTPTPAASKPAQVPAQALGGIGNAQQLKDLQSLPGASAAATAASGLGASAAVASLPTPGAGVGSNAVAALAQQDQQPAAVSSGSAGHRKNGPAQGMTLADYRANAVQTGSMGLKPLIPSTAAQLVQQHGGMPGARAVLTTQAPAAARSPAPAPTAATPVPAQATPPAEAAAPADQAAAASAPPSKERLAELMLMGITKYQQQQAHAASAASAAANSNGSPAARKAGNE
ncbi:hypothetical protein [Niveispirillum sp. BGYR6]|uniref:hypothetical protein n=1 Tax=Niveispirillum sp. BGYR6 TaxID=2971249 RepID=UPI0022B9C6BE|nr:hypothetical protein [Niveispirillum sp. BGYR6]MDG5497178.1 hypothetical protein [Niveispirillum sp. BGYR6]